MLQGSGLITSVRQRGVAGPDAAAALGRDNNDSSVTTYIKFGYRLNWLPHVVAALQPPDEFDTDGGHAFTGEEAVLLLLRRYRSTDPLRAMTWESGRSISAISEAVWFMVCRCMPTHRIVTLTARMPSRSHAQVCLHVL